MPKTLDHGGKVHFEVTCLNLVHHGGKKVIYYTWAYSEKQAKQFARIRFNREHGFRPESYVEMKVKPANPPKTDIPGGER